VIRAGRPAARTRISLLLAASALLGGLAGSASAAQPAPQLRFAHYGLDEGLSQLSVTAVVADDQGFVWIGTQEGLNRFDGHRFGVYRAGPAEGPRGGLASSSVDELAFDGRSRLWVGTNDAGLEVVDLRSGVHTRVSLEHGLAHRRVEHILLDPEGGAWLGGPVGVDRIDEGLRSVRRVAETPSIVAMAWAGRRALALDQDCGLWELDVGASVRRPTPLPAGLRCIAMQQDGDALWIATAAGGVFRLHGETLQAIPASRFDGIRADLGAFLRRQDGTLLFGFADGTVLQALDVDDPRPQPVGPRLDSAITLFMEHASGVLFVGTHTSGLYVARTLSAAVRNDLVEASDRERWPSTSVRSIWSGAGMLLVGTDNGLVLRAQPGGPWQAVDAMGITSIRAIEADGEGGWWVGSHRGLWRVRRDGSAVHVPGLPDPAVTALLREDRVLWVATRGGLARFEDGVADSAGLPPQLDGQFLTSLLRDARGRLWIGSNERGLYRLHPDGTLEHLSTRSGTLRHDSIWALYEGEDATWVGTFSAGVHRIDHADDGIRVFSEAQGLSNGVVYRIEPDPDGRLWLSTNNGLSVLDPATGSVQTLLQGDGLRNREFNSGSSFRTADGLILFGGTEGLDAIEPLSLAGSSPPALPVPSGLRVLGRRSGAQASGERVLDILYADRIALDYSDTVLSLDLVAIDFSAPGAARLRYRIHGIYEDWVQPQGPRAELVLSHLPPGEYPLEMQAAGRDGRFGDTRRLVLEVPPPPWRHPLAWVGYALLLLSLLAWVAWQARARRRAERAQIELLNRTVAERTAELEDANQRLLQTNRQLDLATRIDPLTQVSNRRDLQEWLDRECPQVVAEAAAGGAMRRLFFCMVDVDDFKRINDRYGHQAGDEVLVEFADRLRRLRRERDAVVRWGGEEFMLLLRDVSVAEVAAQVERIRRTLADRPVQLRNGGRLECTCSIGFAPWPLSRSWPSLGDWDQSVSLADRALYAAKAMGKNAWVGVVPSEDIDRATLMALLAGTPPGELPPGSVEVHHSGGSTPSFAID